MNIGKSLLSKKKSSSTADKMLNSSKNKNKRKSFPDGINTSGVNTSHSELPQTPDNKQQRNENNSTNTFKTPTVPISSSQPISRATSARNSGRNFHPHSLRKAASISDMVNEKDFSFLPDDSKPLAPMTDHTSQYYENSKLIYETHVDECFEYYELEIRKNLQQQRVQEAKRYQENMEKFRSQGKLDQRTFELAQVEALRLTIQDYDNDVKSYNQVIKTDQENMEKSLMIQNSNQGSEHEYESGEKDDRIRDVN